MGSASTTSTTSVQPLAFASSNAAFLASSTNKPSAKASACASMVSLTCDRERLSRAASDDRLRFSTAPVAPPMGSFPDSSAANASFAVCK
ncbi:hypothetical protein D3C78_1723920 [compost metagenome]